MTAINRYILRQTLAVMVFVTAALTAAVWLAQSLRLVDLILNRGLSVEMFLYLALLILPRFLDIVLPIGIFIAVLFTFNRLASESELVVMRAAGLGPLALAKPVMMLATLAFAVLLSLSLYFLPVGNREFKDLQFEIRNRFVSSLLQEGTFTTVSDKLTIYIRKRNARGEVSGLLIDDRRDPQKPVTLLAERGAFVDTPSGPRIIMVNGDRQQYDVRSRKLSVLTFERYTLDLSTLRDVPVVRFREAQERFIGELLFPPGDLGAQTRRAFVVEANRRILVPLSAFSFAVIPLACLLPGEFSRRGQSRRVALAIIFGFLYQTLDLAVGNLADDGRSVALPLMYVVALLPFFAGFAILLRRDVALGWRRPAPAGAAGR